MGEAPDASILDSQPSWNTSTKAIAGAHRPVAAKHYLHVTEEHFAKAVRNRCSMVRTRLAWGRKWMGRMTTNLRSAAVCKTMQPGTNARIVGHWARQDSNLRPIDYESTAIEHPTGATTRAYIIGRKRLCTNLVPPSAA